MAEDNVKAPQAMNLRELWHLLVRYKWHIFIPMVIAPLAAVLVTYLLSPEYESTTSILIKESQILPPTLERGLEDQGRYRDPAELRASLMNEIRSTKYIRSLIAKLDIPIPADMMRAVREKTQAGGDVSPTELAENLLVEDIRQKIAVELSGLNILQISVRATTPAMARRMTETLAEIFLEESLAQELAGIQGSISFTEEQLVLYRQKLFEAQNRLKEYRQEMIVSEAAGDVNAIGTRLNSISSAIDALELEASNAEQRRNDLALSLRTRKLDPSVITLSSRIADLKNQLLGTVPKLAELLGRYTWRDSRIVALNQEAKDLSGAIDAEIRGYVGDILPEYPQPVRDDVAQYLSLNIAVEFLRDKIRSMETSAAQTQAQLTRNPDLEITLERLQSEVTRYQELYNLFVQHGQYAAIDQSAKKVEAQSKYMIVQPALLPLAPIGTNRIRMGMLGLVLGATLGGGVILLLIILDDSFKKVQEVEEYLSVPVIATIPKLHTPYAARNKDRALVIAGTVISVVLAGAILYMRSKG